ncbi:MAG: dihydropteroate synthase, partial [Pyrinomonadaceae bacterium]
GSKIWQTSRRKLNYGNKTLVMGILNVTPDSFSDGGKFDSFETALEQAELMIAAGADILDIGGESTRPNSQRISIEEETRRVIPIISEITRQFDIAVSIDTTKSAVARAAIEAGAEIINDISGLRFDPEIGVLAAETKVGLVLMHLRGDFETMHQQIPVERVLPEVITGLSQSAAKAASFGVKDEQIALDIGIGFSKTLSQNLELLARLDEICHNLNDFPLLVGTSRKSFIGKILSESLSAPAISADRLYGTMSSIAIAVFNGANIIRVHDVRAAVETVRIAEALRNVTDRQN